METFIEHGTSKRRPVNLTIRKDILEVAKMLKLNASQAAETGIIQAIRRAQEDDWIKSNKAALMAHNNRVEKDGPLLTPDWVAE